LQSNDVNALGAVSNNLGHIYRLRGAFETATEFYREALANGQALKSGRRECLALEFLGETAVEIGAHDRAIRYLDRALEIAMNLSGAADLALEVLRRRGEARIGLGQIPAAKADLSRAIRMCEARGERRELWLARRSLLLAASPPKEQSSELPEILRLLMEAGDHFEYVRTVCLCLESGVQQSEAWLDQGVASARHFIASEELSYWQRRLRLASEGRPASSPLRPVADIQNESVDSRSMAFRRTVEAARLAARANEPALIMGETGVGKEVISRMIHSWSGRASAHFVPVNCGAIPEQLVESELFGHVRGAFTDASRDRQGLVELARGGTLLLDEVGELPLAAQVKLLRFLDSTEYRRVGDVALRQADVRILAATNRDLEVLAREGRFRADLLFRLNVFRVDVPPLRERREDIVGLAEKFLAEASPPARRLVMADDLLAWLQVYEWPGNIRELRNLCRYLAAKGWGEEALQIRDLPPQYGKALVVQPEDAGESFELERQHFERQLIERALMRTAGNISAAAKILQMGRNNLARRMNHYGLSKVDFADPR